MVQRLPRRDLINSYGKDRFGYERTAFLLLFGRLPDEQEFADFKEMIWHCRDLPTNFTRDVIMKAPSKDIMNSMTRSILTLASYDTNVSDISVENVLRQCHTVDCGIPDAGGLWLPCL